MVAVLSFKSIRLFSDPFGAMDGSHNYRLHFRDDNIRRICRPCRSPARLLHLPNWRRNISRCVLATLNSDNSSVRRSHHGDICKRNAWRIWDSDGGVSTPPRPEQRPRMFSITWAVLIGSLGPLVIGFIVNKYSFFAGTVLLASLYLLVLLVTYLFIPERKGKALE